MDIVRESREGDESEERLRRRRSQKMRSPTNTLATTATVVNTPITRPVDTSERSPLHRDEVLTTILKKAAAKKRELERAGPHGTFTYREDMKLVVVSAGCD